MALQFKKAVKYDAKGRVALVGPAGSGKSFTSLTLARAFAGPKGKIAAIDTEHGSLSKYADLFQFDVIELDSFTPQNFQDALTAAEDGGYDVFLCDSLSHFWTGKDGALEFVDLAAKKHRDGMGGWKEFRPHERSMVDRMVASPCHVIVTMRTKTEYVEEVNPSTGKKQRRKVGLQPVQREGLEYEFDLIGYMDEDNALVVDKSRCSAYAGKAFAKPGAKDFQAFIDWLKGESRGTAKATETEAPKAQEASQWDWKKALPGFTELRDAFGEIRYLELLWDLTADAKGNNGAKEVSDLRDAEQAKKVYLQLFAKLPKAKQDEFRARQGQTKQQQPAVELPKEIADLIAGGIQGQCQAFEQIKKDLIEAFGEEQAADLYYDALKRQGIEHANKFKSHAAARVAAAELIDALSKASEGAAA